MPPSPDKPEAMALVDLGDALSGFFDPDWYVARYPDVAASGTDPTHHFVHYGAAEGRDPNRFFDSAWYLAHYPDVAHSGQHPLLHYLQMGAAELRNPHPRFDAAYYVDQHPEAAANPLLHHLLFGVVRGWLTEKPIAIRDYLPSGDVSPVAPADVVVDIVIPVYRGLAQTRRCIESVLADADRPAGRVIVVDDHSPDPKLSAWLDSLAAEGRIQLVRNRRNRGFVASVNIGIEAAGTHDVVLLNSDTEVANGWLARLAGHAYATPRVASVSPFSNNATICSYPRIAGRSARVRARRGRTGRRLSRGERRPQRRAADHGRLLHVCPPRGIGRYRPVRHRDVRPRLRRGERFLPACQRARLASPAGLRHLRLPRRLGELRRRCVLCPGAGHGGAAGALSALCAARGAAREAGRGGAVPLRPYRGAVPPLQPADDPDADARPGRRRAAAYPRAGRAHQRARPTACCWNRPPAAPHCRCRRCPAIPNSHCPPIVRRTSPWC